MVIISTKGCVMDEFKKLEIVNKSLKNGVSLCVFDYVNDTAIIKQDGAMFTCSVVFSSGMALFSDIVRKDEKVITLDDILKNDPFGLFDDARGIV